VQTQTACGQVATMKAENHVEMHLAMPQYHCPMELPTQQSEK
jgi:hypothetical protein